LCICVDEGEEASADTQPFDGDMFFKAGVARYPNYPKLAKADSPEHTCDRFIYPIPMAGAAGAGISGKPQALARTATLADWP
jgi:hypothetical protein